jgi:Xaa-Pro aminopeptidase
MNANAKISSVGVAPFDQRRLDRLMDEAGIDILVATAKHTVQYMMGGYRFIIFHSMDAIGHSRYLPFFIYQKGRPDLATYVGNAMEGHEQEIAPFWTPVVSLKAWGSADAATAAAHQIKQLGLPRARIGIETPFMSLDAFRILSGELGSATFVDATTLLERMRAVKSREELAHLRNASELVTEAMLAVVASHGEGASKAELGAALRREETARGLLFEYVLISMGKSFNRALSSQRWGKGDPVSIDSGGNYQGYTGDICRMAVLGEPDGELVDLLGEIEKVQQAAISVVAAGRYGREVIEYPDSVLASSPIAPWTHYFAHGMGLVFHEAPFLVTNRPVLYDGEDAARPLEEGMVISVETTMKHPKRGFIKLEDTLAVTRDGCEMFGTKGRGWNVAGG